MMQLFFYSYINMKIPEILNTRTNLYPYDVKNVSTFVYGTYLLP